MKSAIYAHPRHTVQRLCASILGKTFLHWHASLRLSSIAFFAIALFATHGAYAEIHDVQSGVQRGDLTHAEREWLAKKHVVRARVGNYPPYMLTEPNVGGIAVDYMQAVANRYGIEVKFLPDQIGFSAAMADVMGAHEQFDILLTFTRSREREKEFAISSDYLTAPWVVYARRDSPYIIGLESLEGKTVAAEKGYLITEKIRHDFPDIKIIEVGSSESALLAVATGKVDAYVGNLANASYLIKTGRFDDLVVTSPTPYGINTQAMAVRNDWPELASIISKGIAAMSAEERLAITQKWGNAEHHSSTDYALVSEISAGALLLIGIFFYWNRRLAREIGLRKIHQAQTEYLAYHDSLTDLPNRAFGIKYLNELASLPDSSFLAICADISRFSEINRVYGHAVGDHLLQQLGQRLKAMLGEHDLACRISDDQFLIVFADCKIRDEQEHRCAYVLEQITQQYQIDRTSLTINFSLGATVYPTRYRNIDQLLHQADSALQEAKRLGLNRCVVYDEKLQLDTSSRLLAIEDLKLAIENQEFELHYQAKIDLTCGALTGFEALMRWRKPHHGLVSPAAFIPIAEECGLIVPMSRWAILEACNQIALWIRNGIGEISIAVNLSAAHLKAGTLEEDVEKALLETGIPAHLLEIELTESLLMENGEVAASTLRRLKRRGLRLSLDDFGTGYSSLSYLNNFEFDYLKIDQSFVRTLMPGSKESMMCEAIVMMAHKLGMKVVAEGIETVEQLAYLVSIGAEIGQGYHFCKPIPVREIESFVALPSTAVISDVWVNRYQEIFELDAGSIRDTHPDDSLRLPESFRSAKVLIVDDTRFNIKLISKMLSSEGVENIYSTEDPREAEGMFLTHGPDLVILDLLMPHLNGFEVFQRIKMIDTKNTPVVFMTAELNPEIRRQALQEGVRDFITKPFDRNEVMARIRNVLTSKI